PSGRAPSGRAPSGWAPFPAATAPVGSRMLFGTMVLPCTTSARYRLSVRTDRVRRSVLVEDDAADVLAVDEVLVGVVDLVQAVGPGDELVELEVALVVQPQQPGDVVQRVAVAEQGAADLSLVADEHSGVDVHGLLVDVPDGGDGHLAALAGHGDGGTDHLLGDGVRGHDHVVGELPPGVGDDELSRLLGVGEGVGGAEGEG